MSGGQRRLGEALLVIATAQLMVVLDVTVVNVALSASGAVLQLDRLALIWVLTAYTRVSGGLMLLGGRLAGLLGAHRSCSPAWPS